MIKDFFDGMILREEQFLVVSFNKLTSANGNNYGNIVLQDSSGTIEAKKWSIDSEDPYIFKSGNIVSINGEVLSFKGNMQVKLISARNISSENIDYSRFVQHSKLSMDELEEKYTKILSYIKDDELKEVVEYIFGEHKKDIFLYPAAKRNHHNYLRGLITHSLSMAELAYLIGSKYENINIDLLISGALLHDIGKIIELSGPVATQYTVEGSLIGHISLGFYIIKNTCDKLKLNKEKALELEHIVLSHHGRLEYGSPVLPSTKEAILLSMIDDMDAKMEMTDMILANVSQGEFSQRVFSMDDRVLYNPKKK